jgi:hypothetical protein
LTLLHAVLFDELVGESDLNELLLVVFPHLRLSQLILIGMKPQILELRICLDFFL